MACFFFLGKVLAVGYRIGLIDQCVHFRLFVGGKVPHLRRDDPVEMTVHRLGFDP